MLWVNSDVKRNYGAYTYFGGSKKLHRNKAIRVFIYANIQLFFDIPNYILELFAK